MFLILCILYYGNYKRALPCFSCRIPVNPHHQESPGKSRGICLIPLGVEDVVNGRNHDGLPGNRRLYRQVLTMKTATEKPRGDCRVVLDSSAVYRIILVIQKILGEDIQRIPVGKLPARKTFHGDKCNDFFLIVYPALKRLTGTETF